MNKLEFYSIVMGFILVGILMMGLAYGYLTTSNNLAVAVIGTMLYTILGTLFSFMGIKLMISNTL